jgi:aspartyl protease family protein
MKIILHFFLLISLITLQSCNGCSKTRHRNFLQNNDDLSNEKRNSLDRANEKIQMREDNGVFFVPIEINGVEMEFIFDTGASTISISDAEALFLLKQGKLLEEDFKGTQEFIDANGDLSEGTRVILKEVKIGNKVIYNIEASIVHNLQAPLLFGQSAMNKFGKITIDYEENEITFN